MAMRASLNDSVSSNSPVSFRLRWDVFLSFRGEDTRETFIRNLYESLEKEGVRVFRDNDGLDRGDEIAPSLLEAIEDSAAAIVVVSPRYAESRWCLEELAKICDCKKLILPVFHLVDPSHVRRQSGPFEPYFTIHEDKYGNDKVCKWRTSMEKVGGIAGWVFSNSEEAEIIKSLVKKVLTKIRTSPVGLAEYTVGLDSRVEKLIKLLDIKSNGVRVLGLHGTGGVGKTTLATALFNKLLAHFELRSFIPNVRETSAKEDDDQYGLLSLQNKIINDLSESKQLPVTEISAGLSKLNMKVNDKRVLVFLDDVDNVSQLDALIPDREWFHEGSRIIITARNKEVFAINRLATESYEVRELESSESLQLFSFHALRRERPPKGFLELSQKIVTLTGGLPLALEVFGSFLFDKRRIEEWEDSVTKLSQIRPRNLQDVLRISYDGLDNEQEKCIFLDVACLFVQMGMQREEVIDILKGCGFSAETAIADLVAKSLIKIAGDRTLWMHDQVRDMGRQIVREENINYPTMRSRVWDPSDIKAVLMDDKGAKSTQGMVLNFKSKNQVKNPSGVLISLNNFWNKPNCTSAVTYVNQRVQEFFRKRREKEEEEELAISTKPIETMTKLRLLQINHVNLRGKFNSLPAELKWLQWKGCPLKAIPSDFYAPQLTVLDLSESNIERLWVFKKKNVAEQLMILNLSECYSITSIPDLSRHQKLEKLILKHCRGLTQIHPSIGNIQTLIYLNLRGCSNLIKFPNDVSGLKRLEKLILSGCSLLEQLPENLGSMQSLKRLQVDGTSITNLPESTFRLSRLEELNLNGCGLLKRLPRFLGKLCSLKVLSLDQSGVEALPDSIGSLENLEILSIRWCPSLTVVPDSIGNLKSLTEFFTLSSPITELPESVGSLPNLEILSVGKGEWLSRLPISIGELCSLVELQIQGTKITDLPDQIGALKSLETLEMFQCKSLKSLPESIGSLMKLTTLTIFEADITELPESIGMLENLVMLTLSECKKLCKLPDSIGKLKSLHRLPMKNTGVTELPESFGMLSSLITLNITKKDDVVISGSEKEPKHDVLPSSFSNLSLLNEFYARHCNISGKIPDDFEKLSSLEILDLGYNHFCSLPSSLMGLSILKKLSLPHCEELMSLPPLPSSLLEIDVANCTALETVSDLSNLESLHQLNLTNCEKVVDIPSLECLKSLVRLYMSGCNACSSVVKKRLAKGFLRNIRNISMPGSKIPSWFTQEVVTFSERKNHAIKAIIIGVVVSFNNQIPDDLTEIPAIEAKILEQDFQVQATTLFLPRVLNTNEDQFHLCRYSIHYPLVSRLKDGYQIKVAKTKFPFDHLFELKKFGIYLVYEGDDDYEGDEESLNESQQSVSEKLAKFFATYEEDDH